MEEEISASGKGKMKVLLVQQKVAKALEDPSKLPTNMTDAEKSEMHEIAYTTIILHLADNVNLRRVSSIENMSDLQTKLDEFYMSKSLTNKTYLKEKLFESKMDWSKTLEENIDEFLKNCLYLNKMGEKLDGKN